MISNLLKVTVLVFFTGAYLFSSGQLVPISNEGAIADVNCADQVLISDSDADNGNYFPNESYTISICVEDGAETFAQFIISPALYDHVWDIDENSNLFVYDGPTTASPLLGAYNSVSDPAGVFVTATGSCITLTFVSGAESSGEGFTSIFQCVQPLQPFEVSIDGTPEPSPWNDLPYSSIRLCFAEPFVLDAITNFPLSDAGGNGYEQSDETSNFRWDMGDGTIYQGIGLNAIAHTYTLGLGYLVTLIVTDDVGQSEIAQLLVLHAPRPIFSNLAVNDTLCIGFQTTITGGILNGDTVGVSPSSNAILGGGILGDALFLPDGGNNNYETIIPITDFEEGQVLENANDIISMCVNMEHTYLGDLEMMLTCPNGSSVNIFNSFTGDGLFPGGFGGGGTFMGDANDTGAPGVPGIGFDYCFSLNTVWGTLGAEFAAGNTVSVNSFPPGGIAMASGTYQPEQSYEALVGCPLNGDWTLTIRDNLFSDDGWIFNWSIYFNPNINPTTIYYSPDIVEVYWEENEDIIADNGTSIVVEPSQSGNNDFTFFVVDEFGCIHDTTVFVYVRPDIFIADNIACDLTHILDPQNVTAGGEWTLLEGPNETSAIDFGEVGITGFAEISANDYGLYDVEILEFNCSYRDTATIDFRPVPVIAPFVEDTTLCIGASIVFDAGPQEDNSGNFFINWILNNSTLNTEDYAIIADQTGEYILTLTEVCGSATDTVDVVAIQLTFDPVTICGLQAFTEAELSPEGNGTWSGADNITFSNPGDLFTEVNSSTYGPYEITFTDSRCSDDGVSQTFTFVEQPTVEVLLNPDFCIELDSLIITTSVSGNNSGLYLWSITGEDAPTIVDQNDSLFFGPETFVPLEMYTLTVQVFDNFGVCNVAAGSNNFEATWCTYTVPNIITPNGDGMNDSFMIQYIQYFPGTHMRIFNRWGNVVFDQLNFDKFQTTTQGWVPEELTAGTYFYEISIPHVGKVETGNLTIVKKQ